MASSLVTADAALAVAGQTTATTEQTDLSIPSAPKFRARSAPVQDRRCRSMAGKFGFSSLLP
jgi:hypothetical protein